MNAYGRRWNGRALPQKVVGRPDLSSMRGGAGGAKTVYMKRDLVPIVRSTRRGE